MHRAEDEPRQDSRLVAVHVGQHAPGSQAEQLQLRHWEKERESRRGSSDDRPRVPAELNWARHGLTPRWLGQESIDCSAAISPGHFSGHGAAERDRFLAGAKTRGEVAVVVAGIGNAVDPDPHARNVFDRFGSGGGSVWVKNVTYVNGERLPTGAKPQLAEDLSSADRDLALRILNQSDDATAWWSLRLVGATTERGDGMFGPGQHPAEGRLVPLLVDGLGHSVVAAWMSDDEDERWYIIPDGTDWDTLLGWLIGHGLPQFAPVALRRVRSTQFDDIELHTRAERETRNALEKLDDDYARERTALEKQFDDARTRAEAVRDGLLFGTGGQVVDAVRAVLEDCGLQVVDLDATVGTRSADLLVTASAGDRWLIEVKASSGSPKEELARDLERHLATWPQLRPSEPVAGGALIVNHQHRLHPTERTEKVYTRPEFVKALTFPVISSWRLFQWWAEDDHASIISALFSGGQYEPERQGGPGESERPPRRRLWSRQAP
jgi:hypothetical protein